MAGIPNPRGQPTPPNPPSVVPLQVQVVAQMQPKNPIPIQGNIQAGQPSGAATPPVTPKPSIFQEFYSDATKDQCKGSYGRILQHFVLESPNAAEPVMLFKQAVTSSSSMHQAYLCCASTHPGPRIYCLHLRQASLVRWIVE